MGEVKAAIGELKTNGINPIALARAKKDFNKTIVDEAIFQAHYQR